MFKSIHGKYIVAERGGGIFANRAWADDWEKFDVEDFGDGTVAFKSFHGFYLTANFHGTLSARATRLVYSAHFTVERHDDLTVAIKSTHGKYVVAERSGAMFANRFTRSSWEHFKVIDLADQWPGHVAIKAISGRYLVAYPHGALKARGAWPLDNWERFHVTHHEPGVISLRCDHGEYIAAEDNGYIHVAGRASASERFTVVHLPDGNFSMQDHRGRHVWIKRNGDVTSAAYGSSHHAHKFQVVMVP